MISFNDLFDNIKRLHDNDALFLEKLRFCMSCKKKLLQSDFMALQ